MAIELAKREGATAASRKFQMPRSTLRGWLKSPGERRQAFDSYLSGLDPFTKPDASLIQHEEMTPHPMETLEEVPAPPLASPQTASASSDAGERTTPDPERFIGVESVPGDLPPDGLVLDSTGMVHPCSVFGMSFLDEPCWFGGQHLAKGGFASVSVPTDDVDGIVVRVGDRGRIFVHTALYRAVGSGNVRVKVSARAGVERQEVTLASDELAQLIITSDGGFLLRVEKYSDTSVATDGVGSRVAAFYEDEWVPRSIWPTSRVSPELSLHGLLSGQEPPRAVSYLPASVAVPWISSPVGFGVVSNPGAWFTTSQDGETCSALTLLHEFEERIPDLDPLAPVNVTSFTKGHEGRLLVLGQTTSGLLKAVAYRTASANSGWNAGAAFNLEPDRDTLVLEGATWTCGAVQVCMGPNRTLFVAGAPEDDEACLQIVQYAIDSTCTVLHPTATMRFGLESEVSRAVHLVDRPAMAWVGSSSRGLPTTNGSLVLAIPTSADARLLLVELSLGATGLEVGGDPGQVLRVPVVAAAEAGGALAPVWLQDAQSGAFRRYGWAEDGSIVEDLSSLVEVGYTLRSPWNPSVSSREEMAGLDVDGAMAWHITAVDEPSAPLLSGQEVRVTGPRLESLPRLVATDSGTVLPAEFTKQFCSGTMLVDDQSAWIFKVGEGNGSAQGLEPGSIQAGDTVYLCPQSSELDELLSRFPGDLKLPSLEELCAACPEVTPFRLVTANRPPDAPTRPAAEVVLPRSGAQPWLAMGLLNAARTLQTPGLSISASGIVLTFREDGKPDDHYGMEARADRSEDLFDAHTVGASLLSAGRVYHLKMRPAAGATDRVATLGPRVHGLPILSSNGEPEWLRAIEFPAPPSGFVWAAPPRPRLTGLTSLLADLAAGHSSKGNDYPYIDALITQLAVQLYPSAPFRDASALWLPSFGLPITQATLRSAREACKAGIEAQVAPLVPREDSTDPAVLEARDVQEASMRQTNVWAKLADLQYCLIEPDLVGRLDQQVLKDRYDELCAAPEVSQAMLSLTRGTLPDAMSAAVTHLTTASSTASDLNKQKFNSLPDRLTDPLDRLTYRLAAMLISPEVVASIHGMAVGQTELVEANLAVLHALNPGLAKEVAQRVSARLALWGCVDCPDRTLRDLDPTTIRLGTTQYLLSQFGTALELETGSPESERAWAKFFESIAVLTIGRHATDAAERDAGRSMGRATLDEEKALLSKLVEIKKEIGVIGERSDNENLALAHRALRLLSEAVLGRKLLGETVTEGAVPLFLLRRSERAVEASVRSSLGISRTPGTQEIERAYQEAMDEARRMEAFREHSPGAAAMRSSVTGARAAVKSFNAGVAIYSLVVVGENFDPKNPRSYLDAAASGLAAVIALKGGGSGVMEVGKQVGKAVERGISKGMVRIGTLAGDRIERAKRLAMSCGEGVTAAKRAVAEGIASLLDRFGSSHDSIMMTFQEAYLYEVPVEEQLHFEEALARQKAERVAEEAAEEAKSWRSGFLRAWEEAREAGRQKASIVWDALVEGGSAAKAIASRVLRPIGSGAVALKGAVVRATEMAVDAGKSVLKSLKAGTTTIADSVRRVMTAARCLKFLVIIDVASLGYDCYELSRVASSAHSDLKLGIKIANVALGAAAVTLGLLQVAGYAAATGPVGIGVGIGLATAAVVLMVVEVWEAEEEARRQRREEKERQRRLATWRLGPAIRQGILLEEGLERHHTVGLGEPGPRFPGDRPARLLEPARAQSDDLAQGQYLPPGLIQAGFGSAVFVTGSDGRVYFKRQIYGAWTDTTDWQPVGEGNPHALSGPAVLLHHDETECHVLVRTAEGLRYTFASLPDGSMRSLTFPHPWYDLTLPAGVTPVGTPALSTVDAVEYGLVFSTAAIGPTGTRSVYFTLHSGTFGGWGQAANGAQAMAASLHKQAADALRTDTECFSKQAFAYATPEGVCGFEPVQVDALHPLGVRGITHQLPPSKTSAGSLLCGMGLAHVQHYQLLALGISRSDSMLSGFHWWGTDETLNRYELIEDSSGTFGSLPGLTGDVRGRDEHFSIAAFNRSGALKFIRINPRRSSSRWEDIVV